MDPKTTGVEYSVCDPSDSESSSLREADLSVEGCGNAHEEYKTHPINDQVSRTSTL